MSPRRTRSTAAFVALVVAGVVLVVGGLLLTRRTPSADAPDIGRPVVAAAATTGTTTAAASPAGTSPLASPELAVPAAPTALTLPSGADAVPLVPIGVLRSGALALPDRPSVLGWYAGGAVPGESAGTSVIAGHVDSAQYGSGPLRGLLDLRLGDRITVTDAAGDRHVYAVASRTTYRKPDLPGATFRSDGPPQLALITCGGPFDRSTGSYADNVVVLASPVPATGLLVPARVR